MFLRDSPFLRCDLRHDEYARSRYNGLMLEDETMRCNGRIFIKRIILFIEEARGVGRGRETRSKRVCRRFLNLVDLCLTDFNRRSNQSVFSKDNFTDVYECSKASTFRLDRFFRGF